MSDKIKVPKDLGIKMLPKEEAYWTDIKDKCKENIATNKRNIIIDEVLLELANKKILEEQSKK